MSPKQLLAWTGVALVAFGVLFMAAQFAWPDHFANDVKKFSGWGVDLNTNVPGFGVIIIGAVLLLASSFGRPENSK
jgi:uncharacterized membrane protein YidH (DUF202 family)